MDIIADATEAINETNEPTLAKVLVREFAISTAATAGMLVGFAVVGLAIQAVQSRKAKKTDTEIPDQPQS